MTVHTPHAAKPAHRDSIRADIIGSDECHAGGYTVRSASPVLAMCRKLIEARFDPGLPLLADRGDVLCLSVRSIGEGAALTVAEGSQDTPRFRRWKPMPCREGSLGIARQAPAATGDRNRPFEALAGRAP